MSYPKHRGLGNRCDVKAYIPPQRMIEIADERTDGMLNYYVIAGHTVEHLRTLVRSAYMQGIHDMLDTIAVMPAPGAKGINQ